MLSLLKPVHPQPRTFHHVTHRKMLPFNRVLLFATNWAPILTRMMRRSVGQSPQTNHPFDAGQGSESAATGVHRAFALFETNIKLALVTVSVGSRAHHLRKPRCKARSNHANPLLPDTLGLTQQFAQYALRLQPASSCNFISDSGASRTRMIITMPISWFYVHMMPYTRSPPVQSARPRNAFL